MEHDFLCCANISTMKLFVSLLLLVSSSFTGLAQDHARQVYETERAFEKAVAEKGINAGFIEYLSPLGIMFFPEPANGREVYSKRPPSPAALTWNPIKIETSANGALAYSIGNSIYKPKGKDDTTEIYGHYLSIWSRQVNGRYLAALDTGVYHDKPLKPEATWTGGSNPTAESNPKNLFAGDSSIGFYRMAEDRGMGRAYKAYAADDIYLMRQDRMPLVGAKAAVNFIEDQKLFIRFPKRRSFIEAGDLAYVYSSYTLTGKDGTEKEKGNFVQVWKFRGGRWVIAADVFIPVPAAQS